jgi:hypothetical protein
MNRSPAAWLPATLAWLMALTILVAATAVACATPPGLTAPPPATTVTNAPPPATVDVQAADGTITDGTYLVGTDIPAGTWRTSGPQPMDPPTCYWERASDATGTLESIIANGIPTGQAIVTLKPGDYFTTMGCQPWTPN